MRTFNLSILLKSPTSFAADARIDGVWLAHVLDFDIVTQGHSLTDAYAMALEATADIVRYDLAAGMDLSRRRAPGEFWDEFRAIVDRGHPISSLAQSEKAVSGVGLLVHCRVAQAATARRRPPSPACQIAWAA